MVKTSIGYRLSLKYRKFGGNRTYAIVAFHSFLRDRRNNVMKNVFNKNRAKKLQDFQFYEHGRNFFSRIFLRVSQR